MLKNYHEDFCIVHGTMTFVKEAWDSVEEPLDTIEAENGGQSWTQEEIERLFELESQGYPVSHIAEVLGRTRSGVQSKLWALRTSGF
jgi:cytolysin (calcineurin-like family phosphatase)